MAGNGGDRCGNDGDGGLRGERVNRRGIGREGARDGDNSGDGGVDHVDRGGHVAECDDCQLGHGYREFDWDFDHGG